MVISKIYKNILYIILMYLYLLQGISIFTGYVFLDYLLGDEIKGKYYLIHSLNNLIIMYVAFPELVYTLTNFNEYYNYQINFLTASLSYALHLYHIVVYLDKMRFDDWLHHIVMMIAFPIIIIIDPGTLFNFSLFFLTGLPGCINYFLLFLCRNKWITRLTQKMINNYLNLLVRSPGCIATGTLVLATIGFRDYEIYQYYFLFLTVFIVFWNGIYFMNQVVVDYHKNLFILEYKNKIK